MAKIISAAEAVELMQDGMTLGVSGFGAFASPDTILDAMGESFRAKGTPRRSPSSPASHRATSARTAAACPR